MPLCKRPGFENFDSQQVLNGFQDNEEVFFCRTTKKIFRDYDDYFEHIMLINSTIWECDVTKRNYLTYAEARSSELRLGKRKEELKDCLRPIALMVLESAKQSSIKLVCLIVHTFLRTRFFIDEIVEARLAQKVYHKYVIEAVLPSSENSQPPKDNVYDPSSLSYRIRRIGGLYNGKQFTVPAKHLRRSRLEFSHEHLQSFIRKNFIRVDGIIHPKPDVYKKYVVDRKLTFEKTFIGRIPYYEPSNPRIEKKQMSMAKYLVRTDMEEAKFGETPLEMSERLRRNEKIREEQERIRKHMEHEAKKAELERKKAERWENIMREAAALVRKTEDLERYDQKPLPTFKQVQTLIPAKYFGDVLVVQEFMQTFSNLLSTSKINMTFHELTRIFTNREIGGPLTDIFLVLLGSIFDLQQEEEAECAVEYIRPKNSEREPFATVWRATKTHDYVRRHYCYKLNELPLDAQNISEVLRLHFLASGAQVNERAERWRVMYRNGYYSTEDPGLLLRQLHPHILRALKTYTVFQLPIADIIMIINTLIAQILTYSSTLNAIEERLEQHMKAKVVARNLIMAENRRVANVEISRKKLIADYAQMTKERPGDAVKLQIELDRHIADLHTTNSREKHKFDVQLDKLNRSIFDHVTCLGSDRACRKYYVLQSLPGVFVEHPDTCNDECLENPPKNVPHFVGCPQGIKQLRKHIFRIYEEREKSEKQKQVQDSNKENKENNVLTNGEVKINGQILKPNENDEGVHVNGEAVHAEPVTEEAQPQPQPPPPPPPPPSPPSPPSTPPSQFELMMCTGDPDSCIVHNKDHPDRQPWAFFYTEEQLDALIDSLNPFGEREGPLKEQLTTMRSLIAYHIRKCPVQDLSPDVDDTIRQSRVNGFLKDEIRKKYKDVNYGFESGTDLNVVMRTMLVDRILQMELDITSGNLGTLEVDDVDKWRDDIQKGTFEPVGDLKWGFVSEAAIYKDPGLGLGDSIDVNFEEDVDQGMSLPKDSSAFHQSVLALASALLQIEQGIKQRFLSPPFGAKKETKDKDRMEAEMEKGRERLKRWESSLMSSTSYSQVFHHLNILHGAIKWQRSTTKSTCKICRRSTDPEKMLLCDECNGGTHMFCMKPKMKTIPEGNWYCKQCVTTFGLKNETKEEEQKGRKKKRTFLLEEEENVTEAKRKPPLQTEEIEKELTIENEESEDEDETLVQEDEDQSESSEEELEQIDGETSNAVSEGEEEDEQKEEEQEEEKEEEQEEDDDDEDEDEDEEVDEEEVVSTEEDEKKEESEADQIVQSSDKTSTLENGTEEETNSTEDNDDEVCVKCSTGGGEISCVGCKGIFHLECAELRKPPRSNWHCSSCKPAPKKRRRLSEYDESTDDEDYERPPSKRSNRRQNGKRPSTRGSVQNDSNSSDSDEVIRTNNNVSRRARRAGEDLPLNSSILYDLLGDIMKHENAWPFLRPVSQAEVPDYHTIIKEPMDFAKVKSKLNMGKYTMNEELLKDIQLIFRNCDLYNKQGNEIYESGSTLEKFVIEQCKKLNLPYQSSDMNRLGAMDTNERNF